MGITPAREVKRPSFQFTEHGTIRRVPLAPDDMTTRLTPADQLFVIAHFGVGHIAAKTWSLSVEGLVRRPLRLSDDDLGRFGKVHVETVHQCAGNPLAPTVPTRRVGNVIWGGVRLTDVLAMAEPDPAARFLWSDGADGGSFGGENASFFRKDLPLARLCQDVLLATELNGAPITDDHGGPVRLVVPGFFGTNSVKWLCRITLADRRATSPFTTRFYNDRLPGGQTRPVWALQPDSVIVSPAPGETIEGPTEVTGWAWADGAIAAVDISDDVGESWQPATVEPRVGRSWQAWRAIWQPRTSGRITLRSRARDATGETQPAAEARNAHHTIDLVVR